MSFQIENTRFLDEVAPEKIPSLVTFPLEKIGKLYPDAWGSSLNGESVHYGRGIIWDMGFGPANTSFALKRMGFTVGGYDINELAVRSARKRGDFFGKVGDVRYFGLGDEAMWDTVSWLERVDALLFQAVFPSLLGDSWKDALDAADMMLRPGQHMFIGDFMDASRVYPELFTRRELLGERTWNESANMWKRRYEANQEAFGDLGLPYGTFAVGLTGPDKMEYDWCNDPKILREKYELNNAAIEILQLYESTQDPEHLRGLLSLNPTPGGAFERFARHLGLPEFKEYLVNDLGYTIVEEDLVSRRSRSTTSYNRWTVAPGFELTVRKTSTYKYDPWKYGLDPDDPSTYDKAKRRKGSPYRGSSGDRAYFGYILKRVRPSQRPVFEEMARRVGVQV